MSEIRKDPITGEWVIFATERNNRPHDFISNDKIDTNSIENCPFCLGNENQTTKTIFQDFEDSWTIRGFLNKYPALTTHDCDEHIGNNFYNSIFAKGIHELIVDTPIHFQKIYEYSDEHIINVILALKMRFNCIYNYDYIKYVQIFKNCGYNSGMSLAHSHWQIIGMPNYGKVQYDSISNMKKYFNENNRCIMCDILYNDLNENSRIVLQNEKFVAFVPYAPKLSYEIWIAPKEHITSLKDFKYCHIKDFALIFKDIIERVYKIDENISFNVCFMDSPKCKDSKYFHWHVKIIPRIGNLAGYEFSTGGFINPIMPEYSAKFYRNCK